MNYLSWNNCLARYFFSPSKSGQPIHLCLDRDLIISIGQSVDASVDLEDFLQAVRIGPVWTVKESTRICSRALASIRNWRYNHSELEYPPYFAYLALFVAAASLEGEWSSNAYYPRLRQLLNEAGSGTYPEFGEMSWLWEDLEKWSNIDKGGEWGIFRHYLYGGWKHVGLPIAQTLLSEEDRRALPTLFATNALDPQSPPPDNEFLSVLAKGGESVFRPRTLSLLRSDRAAGGTDARQALATLLFAELRDWDGVVHELVKPKDAGEALHGITEEMADGDEANISSGTLRLSCKFDPVSGMITSQLRCKTPGNFSEDGFRLQFQPENVSTDLASVELVGEERGGGWSEPLKRRDTGRPFEAQKLIWNAPFTLRDGAQAWTFRWRAAPVRLLVDGRSESLSGYIEVFRLALHTPILLFAHSSLAAAVNTWGQQFCHGWQALPLSPGVPQGWSAFSADAVLGDSPTSAPHPVLSPPSSVSILLRGGIRAGGGNRFFDFALPEVEVQGPGEISLFCNDNSLSRGQGGMFLLQAGDRDELRLEAKRFNGTAEETVARLAIYIAHSQWEWRNSNAEQWFDAGGSSTGVLGVTKVAGAAVESQDITPFHFGGVIPIMEGGTVHFIGRVPGQISRGTNRPQGWEPVWAVVSRQKGQTHFCALDVANATPLTSPSARSGYGRRELKEWCDWLYTRRKDIAPPTDTTLKSLWNDYVGLAQKLR